MNPTNRGFSLVEVVVAVGVFVAGVVAAVALLSQTTGNASNRLERAAADRVAASTKALLTTLSWDQVIARLDGGETWYANRDGSLIDLVDLLPANERFFGLTLERDVDRFPTGSDQNAVYAELWLVSTWPVQGAAGEPISPANQTVLRSRWVLRR